MQLGARPHNSTGIGKKKTMNLRRQKGRQGRMHAGGNWEALRDKGIEKERHEFGGVWGLCSPAFKVLTCSSKLQLCSRYN